MYYTYVLRSKKNGELYTGSTKDLRKRFNQHNTGKSGYTRENGPYEIIYYESCLNEHDARVREMHLKSGMGKRYLKNRLKGFLSLTGE